MVTFSKLWAFKLVTENLFQMPSLEVRTLLSALRISIIKHVERGEPKRDYLSANRMELSNWVVDSLRKKQHSN